MEGQGFELSRPFDVCWVSRQGWKPGFGLFKRFTGLVPQPWRVVLKQKDLASSRL
jgi:hypothetical protein